MLEQMKQIHISQYCQEPCSHPCAIFFKDDSILISNLSRDKIACLVATLVNEQIVIDGNRFDHFKGGKCNLDLAEKIVANVRESLNGKKHDLGPISAILFSQNALFEYQQKQ